VVESRGSDCRRWKDWRCKYAVKRYFSAGEAVFQVHVQGMAVTPGEGEDVTWFQYCVVRDL